MSSIGDRLYVSQDEFTVKQKLYQYIVTILIFKI